MSLDLASLHYLMPVETHNAILTAAYQQRGFDDEEISLAVKACEMAARHGIKTHNGIKAIHLDDYLGSKVGGCVPRARIEKIDSPYKAVQRWNCHQKLGQAVAFEAMDTCMKLADEYGVGVVTVDNAFHYLWGGAYVIEAAWKGYIAYTACTAATAEVVPYRGVFPTLGTNPHSWAFPTQDILGYPICADWATSAVAFGRVQQFAREGKPLPDGVAIDAQGKNTTDPKQVRALLPFGDHKGYSLALIDELYHAYTGGSLPTLRGRWDRIPAGEKGSAVFFFQCIHPDALAVDFCQGRSQADNVKVVLDDILAHGNEHCQLPGQGSARAATLSAKHGGLLFTLKEIEEFSHIAAAAGVAFDPTKLNTVTLDARAA